VFIEHSLKIMFSKDFSKLCVVISCVACAILLA
jgi:hypothetical protein